MTTAEKVMRVETCFIKAHQYENEGFYNEAFENYSEGAEYIKEDPQCLYAQFCYSDLARCLYYGIGTEKDAKRAFEMISGFLVDFEDICPWEVLGEIYEMGEVTAKDLAKAEECYRMQAQSDPSTSEEMDKRISALAK